MLTFLGGGRGCAGALTRPSTRHLLPKNFEKTALRKRVGIFTVKMRGGHIYGNYCITKKIMVVMVMVMMLVIMVAMVATEGILTMKSEAAMLTIVTMTKL